MRSWPKITLRIFGVLHVVMGLLGISGVVWGYLDYALRAQGPNPRYPYALQFYCVYTIVVLLCLVFLIRAGVALWRVEPRGRWLSNVVLGFEVISSLAEWETIIFLLPLWGEKAKLVADSMLAASGIGAFGTQVQTLTGYPLIALLATNIAYRKLYPSPTPPGSLRGEAGTGWKLWPRAVLRVFGLLDIVVALWWLNVVAVWYLVVVENKIGVDAAHPYVLPIYRAEMTVAASCSLLLIPTAVALWRLKRRGWWMSCGLLAFAVTFLLIELGLRVLLSTRGGEAKAFGNSFENSIGSLFVLPIILYQLVVVIATGVAFRRMRAPSAQKVPTASH